jgi:hypothetical protein
MWFGCTWIISILKKCLERKFPSLLHIQHVRNFMEIYLDGELPFFSLMRNAQLCFKGAYEFLLISHVSVIELLLIINGSCVTCAVYSAEVMYLCSIFSFYLLNFFDKTSQQMA